MSERRMERGCILIADLSGYTAYLANAEPEHAPVIVGDFIETVVGRLKGGFRLMKLEGDAAFMWAPLERVDGSALLDAVEAAYFAFQRRLQSVTQATECDCDTCRRMPELDLKFVAHVGDALRQRIAGREELAGRDVIIAHRLLKGSASERAGTRNYLLVTAAAVEALGLDADALRLVPMVEQYEQLGQVRGYLLDLGQRWQGEQQRTRRARPAGRLVAKIERLLPASPAVAWEYLTAPGARSTWEGMVSVEEARDGRRGVGTVAACVGDRLASVEEILEWRPFETFARRVVDPRVGRATGIYRLAEMGTGTDLEVTWFTPVRGVEPDGRDAFVADKSAGLDRLIETLLLDVPDEPRSRTARSAVGQQGQRIEVEVAFEHG